MDEEAIKALVGEENYKEGMTAEEISTAVQSKAQKDILATGNYVNKEMAAAEKKELLKKLGAANKTLQEKMTDEELVIAAQAQKDAEIEELKAKLSENLKSTNEYKAIGLTAEAKIQTGLKEDDSSFKELISNISSDDGEKTEKTAKGIADLIKKAYENGKAEALKNNLGNMSKFNNKGGAGTNSDDDSNVKLSEAEERAQNLAKLNAPKAAASYFDKK